MKILYTTTIGGTMGFFKALISGLVASDNRVDIATNIELCAVPEIYSDLSCNVFQIDWSRSPLAKGNILAVCQLRKVIADNEYDIVHCHTPIAAACTRFACRPSRKKGLKVIYTAHGFHFYKGAPFKNWLLYFPIEWICSFFTDVLITINTEDFEFAKKHLHAKRTEFVPGVGVNIERFKNTEIDALQKRKELGLPENSFFILSVGELNANKNHECVLRAIASLNDKSIHYAIAGDGPLHSYLEQLSIELGIADRVHLLGWRSDINELDKSADLYILPSKREGLNVSTIEALASGMLVICAPIRSASDLVENELSGFLCEMESQKLALLINHIKNGVYDLESIRGSAVNKSDTFDYTRVEKQMLDIYGSCK